MKKIFNLKIYQLRFGMLLKADGHEEKDVLKIVKTKIDKRFTEFKFLVKEEGQETEISYKAKLKE